MMFIEPSNRVFNDFSKIAIFTPLGSKNCMPRGLMASLQLGVCRSRFFCDRPIRSFSDLFRKKKIGSPIRLIGSADHRSPIRSFAKSGENLRKKTMCKKFGLSVILLLAAGQCMCRKRAFFDAKRCSFCRKTLFLCRRTPFFAAECPFLTAKRPFFVAERFFYTTERLLYAKEYRFSATKSCFCVAKCFFMLQKTVFSSVKYVFCLNLSSKKEIRNVFVL